MTKVEKEKAAGTKAREGKSEDSKAIWSDRVSINGKKIGRSREYDTLEAKIEARRKSQRESKRKIRAQEREEKLRRQRLRENKDMNNDKNEEMKS